MSDEFFALHFNPEKRLRQLIPDPAAAAFVREMLLARQPVKRTRTWGLFTFVR